MLSLRWARPRWANGRAGGARRADGGRRNAADAVRRAPTCARAASAKDVRARLCARESRRDSAREKHHPARSPLGPKRPLGACAPGRVVPPWIQAVCRTTAAVPKAASSVAATYGEAATLAPLGSFKDHPRKKMRRGMSPSLSLREERRGLRPRAPRGRGWAWNLAILEEISNSSGAPCRALRLSLSLFPATRRPAVDGEVPARAATPLAQPSASARVLLALLAQEVRCVLRRAAPRAIGAAPE